MWSAKRVGGSTELNRYKAIFIMDDHICAAVLCGISLIPVLFRNTSFMLTVALFSIFYSCNMDIDNIQQ